MKYFPKGYTEFKVFTLKKQCLIYTKQIPYQIESNDTSNYFFNEKYPKI